MDFRHHFDSICFKKQFVTPFIIRKINSIFSKNNFKVFCRANVKMNRYYTVMCQEDADKAKGAEYVPNWVNVARYKGDCVRMQEMEYWINFTNRVPYNRKLTSDEWRQVKIFNLPKKTLKLQVEPEHLEVFLSAVKFVKPRKNRSKYVEISIETPNGYRIAVLPCLYGRFDDSNISKDFIFRDKIEMGDYKLMRYKFKNEYDVQISTCDFKENQ